MKMTIEMPAVLECRATECAYNNGEACHAHAITIGHGDIPGCDTYFHCGNHCHSHELAGVGACKVTACKHNSDFECHAHSVEIGTHEGNIRCLTFSRR